MRQYLALSQGKTRTAVLKGIDLQSTTILAILTKSRLLEDLTILTGGYLGESLVRAFGHSSSLKSLTLDRKVILQYDAIVRIMIRCPNVVIAEFGSVNVAHHTPVQLLGMWPKLRHLGLTLVSYNSTLTLVRHSLP